jgi:hypothetical protein
MTTNGRPAAGWGDAADGFKSRRVVLSQPTAGGCGCIYRSSRDPATGRGCRDRQAFNRVLHASATQVTPQGHKYLYTCAPSNGEHAEELPPRPGETVS